MVHVGETDSVWNTNVSLDSGGDLRSVYVTFIKWKWLLGKRWSISDAQLYFSWQVSCQHTVSRSWIHWINAIQKHSLSKTGCLIVTSLEYLEFSFLVKDCSLIKVFLYLDIYICIFTAGSGKALRTLWGFLIKMLYPYKGCVDYWFLCQQLLNSKRVIISWLFQCVIVRQQYFITFYLLFISWQFLT